MHLPIPDAGQLSVLVQHQLQNQFFTGTAMTGIIMGGVYVLRSLPRRIINFCVKWFTLQITLNSDQEQYAKINTYVMEKLLVSKLQRDYVITIKDQPRSRYETRPPVLDSDGYEEDETNNKVTLTPGYSEHWGWYQRRPVTVHRSLVANTTGDSFKEQLTLRFYTSRKKVLADFITEANKFVKEDEDDRVEVTRSSGGHWSNAGKIMPRKFETIFLPDEIITGIKSHVDKFKKSRQLYLDRGQPYHTGIFLGGEPGCGKSSLVHALATHLGMGICYLNLGSVTTDDSLLNLFSYNWWDEKILVIEDIDAATPEVASREEPTEKKKKKPEKFSMLSLSAILNSLDGVLTPPGLIVIATSNYPERIDPALMRRGRFDHHVTISKMEYPEFKKAADVYGADISDIDPSKYVAMPAVEAMGLILDRTES